MQVLLNLLKILYEMQLKGKHNIYNNLEKKKENFKNKLMKLKVMKKELKKNWNISNSKEFRNMQIIVFFYQNKNIKRNSLFLIFIYLLNKKTFYDDFIVYKKNN